MNHILVSLSSTHTPEPVSTYADLRLLVLRYSREYRMSLQEAYNILANSHNRYSDDPVYGPGYNGPRRLGDQLETLVQREEERSQASAFLIGGLAALLWVAGLLWLWSSL